MDYIRKVFNDENDMYVSFPSTDDNVICQGGKTLRKQFEDIENEIGRNEDGTDIELPTTDKTIKGAITELFQYASNGKNLIANAITGKGIATNANDSFQTMATNIGKISGGDTINQNTLKKCGAKKIKVAVLSDIHLYTEKECLS